MNEQTKDCVTCKVTKPLSAFSKRKVARDGYQSRCKECAAEYHIIYYAKTKDRKSVTAAAYYIKNREKLKANNTKYYRDHIVEARASRLKSYHDRKNKEKSKTSDK